MRLVSLLLLHVPAALASRSLSTSYDEVDQKTFQPETHVPHVFDGAENFNWLPRAKTLEPGAIVHMDKAMRELRRLASQRRDHWEIAHWPDHFGLVDAETNGAEYHRKTEQQLRVAAEAGAQTARVHYATHELPTHRGRWVNPQLIGAEHLNGLPRDLPLEARLHVFDAAARMRSLQRDWVQHRSSWKSEDLPGSMYPWHRHHYFNKRAHQQRVAEEAGEKALKIHEGAAPGLFKPEKATASYLESDPRELQSYGSGRSYHSAPYDGSRSYGTGKAVSPYPPGNPMALWDSHSDWEEDTQVPCLGRLCGMGKKKEKQEKTKAEPNPSSSNRKGEARKPSKGNGGGKGSGDVNSGGDSNIAIGYPVGNQNKGE